MAGTSGNVEDTIDGLIAPTGGVTVGTCYLIGNLLVMAQSAADAAATFTGKFAGLLVGVTKYGKTGKAWAVGAALYWDNTNKRWTVDATGNTKKGYAAAVATAAATTGNVILVNI